MPIITIEEMQVALDMARVTAARIERDNFKEIVISLVFHGNEPIPDDVYKSICQDKKLLQTAFDILVNEIIKKLLHDIDALPKLE